MSKIALGKSFEKFCDAGKSIVPKTSSAIAKKRIMYTFMFFFFKPFAK